MPSICNLLSHGARFNAGRTHFHADLQHADWRIKLDEENVKSIDNLNNR